jgi:hypothetical protein
MELDLGGKDNEKAFTATCRSQQILPIEACHLHLRFKVKHLATSARKESNATQIMHAYENSQAKLYSIFKPKDYFAVLSKLMGLESVEPVS